MSTRRHRVKTLSHVSTFAFLFVVSWGLAAEIASAQNPTLQSLSSEVAALEGAATVTDFAEKADDIWGRAIEAMDEPQWKQIQNQIGDLALAWISELDAGPLNLKTEQLLIRTALPKMEASQSGPLAAKLLLRSGAMDRYAPDVIHALSGSARGELSADQIATLLQQGNNGLGDLAAVSYETLLEHLYYRMQHLYPDGDSAAEESRRQLLAEWAQKHDPTSLAANEVDFIIVKITPELPGDAPSEFRATWTARLVPPQSGKYEFSVTPLVLSRSWNNVEHRQWMTVKIAGQTVIQTSPDAWSHAAAPLELQAAVPVPVEVTLRYSLRGDKPFPAPGQLFWSGPGIENQVVGASFYRLPDSDSPGVNLTVLRTDRNGTHRCDAVVASIDQILGKREICRYESTLTTYADQLVDHFSSTEFMNQARGAATDPDPSKRQAHPVIGNRQYMGALRKSSSSSRRKMAATLALAPDTVGLVDIWQLIGFYDVIRNGAQRESLDMVGAWMLFHADRASELTGDAVSFYRKNREPYRHLIDPFGTEHGQSGQWLEADYLETEDGRCCLPAAYTLAYCYSATGRMMEWIEKLDARLDDPAIAGDKRVNWLIARAMAEEIRTAPEEDRHFVGSERINAGIGWIDEAVLVAQSADVKSRAVQERVARLSAMQKFEAAEAQLEGHTAITPLGSVLANLRSVSTAKKAAHAKAADAAFLAEIRRRHARAAARGDTGAVTRYQSMIESIEENLSSTP